jgi:starch phosphorylase
LDGHPLKLFIEIPYNSSDNADNNLNLELEKVYFEVWEIKIGRNSLYLLSTDVPENVSENRVITYYLYGGDSQMRLKQEILLGMGGTKVLKALKINPTVWHMNEGHSIFVVLQRPFG